MTIDNGYCTLEELHNHVMANGGGEFTNEDDSNMEIAIEAISRNIDGLPFLETNFYGAAETRYFTAAFSDTVYVDDLISITTLKTDGAGDYTYNETWAITDYFLLPRNARVKANAKDMKPYREITTNINGNYSFPTHDHAVEIVGTWGYTNAVPSVVKQACLLMAHRVWKRKDTIFGIAGTPQLGVQIIQAKIQIDSDIIQLLSSLDTRAGYYAS